MKRTTSLLGSLLGAALFIGASAISTPAIAAETWPDDKGCKKVENPSNIMQGWCAAIDRRRGNCLACHNMVVSPWPEGFPPSGDIAPPLVAMKSRFPDTAKLRAQIYDARDANPNTMMLPFGPHAILSDAEIDNIVEFLLSI